jgi:diguanylate cyclase (GGDEF)-like protein
MVDISMDDIAAWQKKLTSRLVGLELLMTALVIVFSVALVSRALVRPINQLSQAAKDYSKDKDISEHNHFSELDIHTHDEIGDLADSMKTMEQDLNDKISKLFQTTSELSATRQEASKMNELAMKDALTGVRNKRAYDSAMAEQEEALAAGDEDARNFGLAVIDLNGLKQINDTYGHENGNIAIRELCTVVCDVFAHSPVYRIGGDEFVVVLKGQDLENIDTLVDRLNSSLAGLSADSSLHPWERVSAAIGYAVYDADRDDSTESTFRRADRKMYMHKQKMKAGR